MAVINNNTLGFPNRTNKSETSLVEGFESEISKLPPELLSNTAAKLMMVSMKEDLGREGLQRTPERFAKAMGELTSGYELTLESVIGEGVFSTESAGLVAVRDVEFQSLCEHHMLPFWGHISVAYYPSDRIVGLSKIPRIIDMFAKRLQVQERLTEQVAKALQEAIAPRAVLVRATAAHMCMMMRGIKKQDSETLSEVCFGEENLSKVELDRLFRSVE